MNSSIPYFDFKKFLKYKTTEVKLIVITLAKVAEREPLPNILGHNEDDSSAFLYSLNDVGHDCSPSYEISLMNEEFEPMVNFDVKASVSISFLFPQNINQPVHIFYAATQKQGYQFKKDVCFRIVSFLHE